MLLLVLLTIKINTMNLDILLDQVLPTGSLLYKDCHGAYDLYLSDLAFIDGNIFLSQHCDEGFAEFIARAVKALMEKEEQEKDNAPSVSIDYAIFSHPRWQINLKKQVN
jgi:hypothetical protein